MLHGEEAGRGAGRRTALGVDVLDVGASGLRGDDEVGGDLLGGCTAGDEAERLDLAPGQSGGPDDVRAAPFDERAALESVRLAERISSTERPVRRAR